MVDTSHFMLLSVPNRKTYCIALFDCYQNDSAIAKDVTPLVANNVDVFIRDLFATLKNTPKANKCVNLLAQLQKQRESDRPIAEIHHTFNVLRQTLEWWQRFQHQELLSLMQTQKEITTRVMNLSIRNEQFNSKYMSRLHEFHTRLVPKHDHHGLNIAKEGLEKFLRMRDDKVSVAGSQNEKAIVVDTTTENRSKDTNADITISGPLTKRKKRNSILAKLAPFNPNADRRPKQQSSRTQRKRNRDSVAQLSVRHR